MIKNLNYETAVKRMAHLEERVPEAGKKVDLFDRSSILAVLFQGTKEKTMNDLLKERKKMFGRGRK
jgi:hypothetical protein